MFRAHHRHSSCRQREITMVLFMRVVGIVALMIMAVIPASAATACGIFGHDACQPDFGSSSARDLWWEIQNPPPRPREPQKPTRELNTIAEIITAVRQCWAPPRPDQARPGMQITVQLSFTRDGEIFGKPRLTYETPDTSPAHKSAYRRAVAAALANCTPLVFSPSLGNAIVGRPLTIRFVDERNLKQAEYAL
jgi:hypothetical protein